MVGQREIVLSEYLHMLHGTDYTANCKAMTRQWHALGHHTDGSCRVPRSVYRTTPAVRLRATATQSGSTVTQYIVMEIVYIYIYGR